MLEPVGVLLVLYDGTIDDSKVEGVVGVAPLRVGRNDLSTAKQPYKADFDVPL